MKNLDCPKCGKNDYFAVQYKNGASLICKPCHLVVYNVHGRIEAAEVEVNTDYRIIKAWRISTLIASVIFGSSLGLFPLVLSIPAMLIPLSFVALVSGFITLVTFLIRRTFEPINIKWDE
jgi:hypothetical protein